MEKTEDKPVEQVEEVDKTYSETNPFKSDEKSDKSAPQSARAFSASYVLSESPRPQNNNSQTSSQQQNTQSNQTDKGKVESAETSKDMKSEENPKLDEDPKSEEEAQVANDGVVADETAGNADDTAAAVSEEAKPDENAGKADDTAAAVSEEAKPEDTEEKHDELEVTAEGTANTGKGGIKKIFFVKQKSPPKKDSPETKGPGILQSFSAKMGKFAGSLTPTFDSMKKPMKVPSFKMNKSPKEASVKLEVGNLVTANFLGMDERPGKIVLANEDGSFDVLYDHGAKEVRVSVRHINKVSDNIVTDDGEVQPEPEEVPATSWWDMPPTDPREFEVFWDPAQGPLFFTLSEYRGGGIVATKVNLANEKVKNTRLMDGSMLTLFANEDGAHSSLFTLKELEEQIKNAEAPLGFRFREGAPIYREESIEEALASVVWPHVATFFPRPIQAGDQKAQNSFSFSLSFERVLPQKYEDMFEVSQRAMNFLHSFNSHGIRTNLINLETLALPEPQHQDYQHSAGLFTTSGDRTRLVQVIRLWWSFSDQNTVKIERTDEEVQNKVPFGLVPVKNGEDGGFIVVQAVAESACDRAGIPINRNLILTHVNGYDVCPPSYRSIAMKRDVSNTWSEAVIPLFMDCEKYCNISYI